MKKPFIILTLLFLNCAVLFGQSTLSIHKIMQGPDFVGNLPENPYWGEHGEFLYFDWNPDNNPGDSLYRVSLTDLTPVMVSARDAAKLPARNGEYNKGKTLKTYSKNGDIYLYDLSKRTETQITNTIDRESSPGFSQDGTKVFYELSGNLYSWGIANGLVTQHTDFRTGSDRGENKLAEHEQWVADEEMNLIEILQQRKESTDGRKSNNEKNKAQRPKTIYTEKANISSIQMSPDEQYITYALYESPSSNKPTKVPNYVTESGYTEELSARPKVGSPTSDMSVGIYDIANDTTYMVTTSELPGIDEHPEFIQDKSKQREVYIHAPGWSKDGTNAMLIVRSKDNKDRWICKLDIKTGKLSALDHQHDDAWIGGPGIGWSQWDREIGWMPDNQHIWFQSEESGYSHLYTVNVKSGKRKALTKGNFEIYNPRISNDKQAWYFESNKEHPGVRHLYKMSLDGGKMTQLTTREGRIDAVLSPDESKIAITYSASNKPGELYIMDNNEGAELTQITQSTTEEFNSYSWRVPEFVTFKAKDGANVHARLYKPSNAPANGPAVIFVHGAGYLQNAHKWWSTYYREYMFHNLLVDNGYTVLDIDYRASAGYGRDWRTGIYQHMGGLDLSDHVDGAYYLVNEHGIDPKRLGIYGGSYGGFITLMAMFTEPGTFAAGAALRSVTDWAHYNHGYTSNILNTPVEDPEAYRKSSPIYFAEGLEGALLMCHGMIDTNVQFQDIVRLSQRLIELEKENWELAVYPLEGHGFKEASSWADEYSRIFKLFEENLK